jgi:protein involved in temperature-dependent protein secretion
VLAAAGFWAGEMGNAKEAVALMRRAAEVNPWKPSYRGVLASLLAQQGAWDEAAVHCRAWRELNPLALEARRLWRNILLRQGRHEEADAEQAVIRVLQGS